MEIERKFLLKNVPEHLDSYPSKIIEQAYLCTSPVIRIRKQNDDYFLTYKGSGLMVREEHNMILSKDGYEHLKGKMDGILIKKTRFLIPLDTPFFADNYTIPSEKFTLMIELDVFHDELAPLILAEIEFPDEEMANAFQMPDWFLEDVTSDPSYQNCNMCFPNEN